MDKSFAGEVSAQVVQVCEVFKIELILPIENEGRKLKISITGISDNIRLDTSFVRVKPVV